MASSTKVTRLQLEAAMGNFRRAHEQISGDRRWSSDYKSEQLRGLRAGAQQRVTEIAAALFGKPGRSGTLEGGAYWQERATLEGALRRAKTEADNLDPARLAIAHARVPSIIAAARTMGDLREAYANADDYTRRALQDVGPAMLRSGRLASGPGLGSMLGDLGRDRDASLRTPAVEAAEDALLQHAQEAAEAYAELRAASQEVGADGLTSESGRILRGVKVTRRVTDASRFDAKVETIIERQQTGGVFMPETASDVAPAAPVGAE